MSILHLSNEFYIRKQARVIYYTVDTRLLLNILYLSQTKRDQLNTIISVKPMNPLNLIKFAPF